VSCTICRAVNKDQRFGTCRGETVLNTRLAALTKARQNMVTLTETAITAVSEHSLNGRARMGDWKDILLLLGYPNFKLRVHS